MNTKKISTKFCLLLSALITIVMGVAGCGLLKFVAAEAKIGDANQPNVEVVGEDIIEIGLEPIDSPGVSSQNEGPSSLPGATGIIPDDEAIRDALGAHLRVDGNALLVVVKEIKGKFARGRVDNGYFLAAMVGGEWVIVADGQGIPDCDKVARYGFPTSMVPECELPADRPKDSDEDAIRAALAAYHGMDVSEFYHFEVKQNTGSHARGGVDNGYFLAAKVDGQWVRVDGGQKAPNCNEVARYGFPTSMVPECEPTSDRPADSDQEAIRAALAAHFEMDESEFYRFEVKQNTGSHARGGVDNGYFLAAKVDGQWIFVDGGHAAPNCNEVAKYGFPASMVPWCPTGGSKAPDCPGNGTTVATFIADVTYPDGTLVSPGQSFIKTWRIKNVGTCTWDKNYQLVFDRGDRMSGPAFKSLTDANIPPGKTLDVSLALTAPETPGLYRGYWKLRAPNGEFFALTTGSSFWVEVLAAE